MIKKITLYDIIISLIIIIILILFFAVSFFHRHANHQSILKVKSHKSSYYFSLNEDRIIEIDGRLGITKIEIKDGAFRFLDSPCEHRTCVLMGKIRMSQYPVICIPNKVTAYIVDNENEPQFDGVTQ